MKRTLLIFGVPLLAGIAGTLLGPRFSRPAPAPAARFADPAPARPSLPGRGSEALPLPVEMPAVTLTRWRAMAATGVAGLAAADEGIQSLAAKGFPDICGEVLTLPEPERTSLARLLCIRWAELDGASALQWAKVHFHASGAELWASFFNDLAATWFRAQPNAASVWFSEVLSSPERESWVPLGRHFAFESWAAPGNIIQIAKAKLAGLNPHSSVSVFANQDQALGRQVTSLHEVLELKKMVEEFGTRWPVLERTAGGRVRGTSTGHPGLRIARVFEQAWPRIDPQGWRAYAAERVVGADGGNLLLELAVSDCRAAADPLETARAFLASPAAELVDNQSVLRLASEVEKRQSGGGWALFQSRAGPGMEDAVIGFLKKHHPADLPEAMGKIESLHDPAVREKAGDMYLQNAEAAGFDIRAWLDQQSGWSADRLAAFHEMKASAPLR